MATPAITVSDDNEILLTNVCIVDADDVENAISDLDKDRQSAYAHLTDEERSELMREIARHLNVAILADAVYDCLADTCAAEIGRALDRHDNIDAHRVSISKFARQFSDDYETLYEQKPCPTPNTPPTRDDLDRGDELIREHHPLVSELARYRRDVLSSDREVIAFVRALRAFDLLDVDPSRLRFVP